MSSGQWHQVRAAKTVTGVLMLLELTVENYAVVERVRVRFHRGLNLLTGETGSGKSLIIDGLGLALGARASTDQVRHGAERAVVEAVFDSVVLLREIGKRGAARIDGRPAAPGQLREIADRLVALHGQHEHHALLDSETQTELLDAYGGTLELRSGVAIAHTAWVAASTAMETLVLRNCVFAPCKSDCCAMPR